MESKQKVELDGKPDNRDYNLSPANYTGIYDDTDELEKYEFNAKIGGKYLVFNHNQFNVTGCNLSERTGTNCDVKAITETFDNLQFSGKVHHDLCAEEIETELKNVFENDFSNFNSLFIFILTHGNDNNTLFAQDEAYNFESLLRTLLDKQHQTLVGKPKVFVIQACRGNVVDEGISSSGLDSDESSNSFLPVYCDLLIAYAAPPGFLSHRVLTEGTWFIQTLCETVGRKSKKYDFETMLRIARRKVATGSEYEVLLRDKRHKQIPVAQTTLTKSLYLTYDAFRLNH